MRSIRQMCALALLLSVAVPAGAAEHPSLIQARVLYNAADYDGAIDAAAAALSDPGSAAPATLVGARAYLERYRVRLDPADLASARTALSTVRASGLAPRDYLDLLVGLGQALYLSERFGAAADLFDVALGKRSTLSDRDQRALIDWWATALDREAWTLPVERRGPVLDRVRVRMEDEVRQDPGHAVANYWLAASPRAVGDLDRAWDAALAAWVRAPLRSDTAAVLRADIDRFVEEVLVPERARTLPGQETTEAASSLKADWDAFKSQWP